MDDLVVNDELTSLVRKNEDTNAATTIVERVRETREESTLVKDWERLLDITSLSHGDDGAVVTDVKDTVLLEDRAKHVLHNDGGSWVADEARFLV